VRVNTCRLCKKAGYETAEPRIKYSVRHYVHGSCGLNKWGAEFLDKLHPSKLGKLPVLVLRDCGLEEEARKRYRTYQEQERKERKTLKA
jgi:hypothetical protein